MKKRWKIDKLQMKLILKSFKATITFFVDSAFIIALRISSTLFRSEVHFSLLSEANFISLAWLMAIFLFPDFTYTNADFLDLHLEKKDM